MNDDDLRPVRVWDLPTRLFHWTLALCVVGAIVSANAGGDAMVWHFRLGYTIFALLLFRVVWGVVGGRWSRFRRFVYAPSATWRYLRGRSRPDELHHVGHTPLGAFSVFALLAILAVQVATGLFADDEISNTGPLINFVSHATSGRLTGWHKGFGQWLIYGMVALHVLAIAWYGFVRRRNLVGAMIHGDKPLTRDVPPSVDSGRSRALALLLIVLCGLVVRGVVGLGD